MTRKQVRRENIDENLILNLIDGVDAPPGITPKLTPVTDPPKMLADISDYERAFLQSRKCHIRMICRLERDLWQKLNIVVRFLGNGKLTVPGLVNNIIQHHIETYREEINEMIRNSTKNI